MKPRGQTRLQAMLSWSAVAIVMIAPILAALFSPYLASRNVPYLLGGFAGIVCLSLLFLQPLLPAGYLAGSKGPAGRLLHHWVGAVIVLAVALHVAGLYVTSPSDTMDALMLVSPTPFSVYGVTAMVGVGITVILVLLRRKLGWRYAIWRLSHNIVGAIVVLATIVHALQIEGAMEPMSKWMLCLAVAFSTIVTLLDLRLMRPFRTRGSRAGA